MASGSVASIIEDGLNAGSHNSIYRGECLGTSISDACWANIKNGTFAGLFIGDYWTIDNVNWRIAAFDYWINPMAGKTDHHVVIVPDTCLANGVYHSTATSSNAYTNSDFRKGTNSNTLRSTAISAANNAFGSSHIYTYKDYLRSSASGGVPNGNVWEDCTVELLTEKMLWGNNVYGRYYNNNPSSETVITTCRTQLPLFKYDRSSIVTGYSYWLRDVAKSTGYSIVDEYGCGSCDDANVSHGIRPCFPIYQS